MMKTMRDPMDPMDLCPCSHTWFPHRSRPIIAVLPAVLRQILPRQCQPIEKLLLQRLLLRWAISSMMVATLWMIASSTGTRPQSNSFLEAVSPSASKQSAPIWKVASLLSALLMDFYVCCGCTPGSNPVCALRTFVT